MDEKHHDRALEKGDDFSDADDNVIQNFRLEETNLRGRAVRLGSVLDEVLQPHDYPLPVAHLVAETMTLALLLSSMLKYNGIFTLQTSGDGPIKMLVADVTSDGQVRACASFDEERLQHAREQLEALKTVEGSQNHLAQYLGKGYIAFTVDQGAQTERYQGIVELKGASLTDCVQHYFSQSEQIGTAIKMAAGLRDGIWRSGGMMVQRMPEHDPNFYDNAGNLEEDDWRRTMILLDSCKEDEILSPELHSNALLYRLFHEEGVRVFEPVHVRKGCRCDSDKVKRIIASMDEEEIEYMAQDGRIEMRCEFCSRDFVFDLDELKAHNKAKVMADAKTD